MPSRTSSARGNLSLMTTIKTSNKNRVSGTIAWSAAMPFLFSRSGTFRACAFIEYLLMASAMAANKVRGIRAAMCYDLTTARSSREHNNANVLTLGGKILDTPLACEIVNLWLTTDFAGGRHWPRVNKIMAIERKRR